MIKKRILTGAVAISVILGMSPTSVFASCESDPSYEWVRLSHEVHQNMLNEIATGGLVAASDARGLYNATAYTTAYAGKEYVSHQGETRVVYDKTNAMFNTVHDNIYDDTNIVFAAQSYITSVMTYWQEEEMDASSSNTASWNADFTTILGSVNKTFSLVAQNNKVDQQVIADKKVKELVKQFEQQSSDPFELAKIVSDYLKDNVTYKAVPKGDPESSNTNTVYGALIKGTADCTGYAVTFNEIMNELGFPTMNVEAWYHIYNKTRVNGQWYYTDVTFSDSDNGSDWVMLTESEFYSKPYTTADGNTNAHNETYWSKTIAPIAYSVEFRNDQNYEANVLKSVGLFSGDANGFRLSDSITRAEMAALLVKVVGASDEVANNSASYASKCTFTDVPNWAKPSVGYCVEKGLINGIGNGLYGSSNTANKLDFCTVLLRALGKSEVQYKTSDADAVALGYLEYGRAAFADLNRADVVNTVYNAYEKGAIK